MTQLPASAETRSTAEPRADWIPLRKAEPFFDLSPEDFAHPENLPQKFERHDAKVAKIATTTRSRRQLTKMLKEFSGAYSAETTVSGSNTPIPKRS